MGLCSGSHRSRNPSVAKMYNWRVDCICRLELIVSDYQAGMVVDIDTCHRLLWSNTRSDSSSLYKLQSIRAFHYVYTLSMAHQVLLVCVVGVTKLEQFVNWPSQKSSGLIRFHPLVHKILRTRPYNVPIRTSSQTGYTQAPFVMSDGWPKR